MASRLGSDRPFLLRFIAYSFFQIGAKFAIQIMSNKVKVKSCKKKLHTFLIGRKYKPKYFECLKKGESKCACCYHKTLMYDIEKKLF